MNTSNLFFLFFLNYALFSSEKQDSSLVLLDSIAVLRLGSSGLVPIFYSDGWFLNPFGQLRDLEEIIIQNIWIAYGSEHGIKMISDGSSSEYAEQYFDMLQEQRGISRKKIEELARENGYSIENVKEELNNKYLMQQTMETAFAANGKLNISNDEILEFYNNFPIFQEEAFIIDTGLLFLKEELVKNPLDNEVTKDIKWNNKPYLVLKKDLNDNFSNISNFSIGDIFYYEYLDKKNSFLYYKLVDIKVNRRLTCNELYEDMTKKIQAMKYEDSYKEMTKQFLLSDNIIYDKPELRERCINYLEKNE